MDKLLTPAEVAPWAGITAGTARDWMAGGKVPGAFPHGATFLVSERDLKVGLEAGTVGVLAQPDGENGPPVVTAEQARQMLAEKGINVVLVTVHKWLSDDILPGTKTGKAWAVDREKLEAMLEAGFQPPKRGRPSNDASDV